jgi:hypoxanthine-guanine phosphoribosyltransferase
MKYLITSRRSGNKQELNQEQLDVFLKRNNKYNYKVQSVSDLIRAERQQQLGVILILSGCIGFLLMLLKIIN